MAELRTVEGCGRIFTEEREEVIHHLAEMRVAETHTHKMPVKLNYNFFLIREYYQ